MPPDTAAVFEQIAAEEGRTKSELFREMLRVYQRHRENSRLELLQRYGTRRGLAQSGD